MSCGIYCIENLINGKKYIGQSRDIQQRWSQHIGSLRLNKHCNPHLQKEWNQYGSDSFSFSVIENCDKELLDAREMYYISKYNAFTDGYNYSMGGKGAKGFITSDETRMKRSKAVDGLVYNLRKHYDNYVRPRDRKPPNRDREECRKQILEQFRDEKFLSAFRANIESQMVSIRCYNKNGYICEYSGIHEAARDLHIPATNICKVLKGKHKTCCGYTFCYQNETLSDGDLYERYVMVRPSANPHGHNAKIEVFDNLGNSLGEFNSIEQVAKLYNLDPSSISKVCRGKLKHTGGYSMKYID